MLDKLIRRSCQSISVVLAGRLDAVLDLEIWVLNDVPAVIGSNAQILTIYNVYWLAARRVTRISAESVSLGLCSSLFVLGL